MDNFIKDGIGVEYEIWVKEFDVDKKMEDIVVDFVKYFELRMIMEKLVFDMVFYVDFWKRYYFFRYGIEIVEVRCRDLFKGKIMSLFVYLEICIYVNMI